MDWAPVFKPKTRLLGLMLVVALGFPIGLAQAQPNQQAGYQTSDYSAGVQAYRHGDYQQAIRLLKTVIAKDAAHTNAHYYLGLSLDKLGMNHEAATEYAYVISNSREANIVAYATGRWERLRTDRAPVSGFTPVNSGNMAMIASGIRRSASVYKGSTAQIAVPLKNSKNALIVDALLTQGGAQTAGAFIIDTGATYTSISQEMAEQLNLDLRHCETVQITTANGRIEVPKVFLESLNVNGLEAHNIEATVIPVRQGASFSGLLGLSFIRQFVVTIDPEANQLIFQKNQ